MDKKTILETQNIDLKYLSELTQSSIIDSKQIASELYRQELQKFISDLRFQKSEIAIAKKEYLRQEQLYKQKVTRTVRFG